MAPPEHTSDKQAYYSLLLNKHVRNYGYNYSAPKSQLDWLNLPH